MNLLSVQEVSKRFGGVQAVHNCSLGVKKGSITALIGPNGCGKTTLFNVISQFVDEDAGAVIFRGKDISGYTPYRVANDGISRTFQHPQLFDNLTVQDHLEIALLRDDASLVKSVLRSGQDVTKQCRRVLRTVGFNKPLDTKASDLSYGQRKLLDLAVALAKPHKILLLDEPVAGVNPRLRKQIQSLLDELRSRGETIFVIEHDMNFVMDLADTVHVMDQGRVIVSGPPGVIREDDRVLEAYLGK